MRRPHDSPRAPGDRGASRGRRHCLRRGAHAGISDFGFRMPKLTRMNRMKTRMNRMRKEGVQVFGCSGVQEGVASVGPEHLKTRTPEHPSLHPVYPVYPCEIPDPRSEIRNPKSEGG